MVPWKTLEARPNPQARLVSEAQRRDLAMLRVLRLVPLGSVCGYGQIADLSGYPRHARWVARVLKRHGDAVPWHRILRSDGRIAFPEHSESAQRQCALLRSEGITVSAQRVDMRRFGWHGAVFDLAAMDLLPPGPVCGPDAPGSLADEPEPSEQTP